MTRLKNAQHNSELNAMKAVSNRVNPKIRDRILLVVNRLYDQGGRREEPSGEAVCRLAGASPAVCNEVIREWRGRLAATPSEAGGVPTSEWIRKLSELIANNAAVDENLAAAVESSRAQTTAINQCVTEIVAGFVVQAEELRLSVKNAADLQGRMRIAVEAAAVSQREAGETKSQLEMMTKEFARVVAENDEIRQLAGDLKAGLSSADASAQLLFAKIDSHRAGLSISSARRSEIPTSEPERSDQLKISNVDLAEAATARLHNEIQGHGDPTKVIAMASKKSARWSDPGNKRGSCQDCVSHDKAKPQEDVKRLKNKRSGDWGIDTTAGFGAHYAELMGGEAIWDERHAAAVAHAHTRLEEYVADVGTPGNTALPRVLNRLAAEIKALELENSELFDRMNLVEARLERLK